MSWVDSGHGPSHSRATKDTQERALQSCSESGQDDGVTARGTRGHVLFTWNDAFNVSASVPLDTLVPSQG